MCQTRTVAAAREDLKTAIGVSGHVQHIDPAAERVPAAPAVVRSRLPHMPDGAVAAAREDLEAAVGVSGYVQHVDPAAERVPAAPAIVGSGLPHMPERAIAAAREDLEPAIGVLDHVQPVDPAAHRVPAAPAAARAHFPIVPDGAVAAAREDLEAPVLVRRDLDQVDPAAERMPVAPAVVGSRLPPVPHGTVAATGADMDADTLRGHDDRCRHPEPRLVRDRPHRRLVDDADRVPGEHGIALRVAIHPGRYRDAELLRQPGHAAVAAERDAVILIGVGVKSRPEPAIVSAGKQSESDRRRCRASPALAKSHP